MELLQAEAEAETRIKREREEETAASTGSAPSYKRPREYHNGSQACESGRELENSFSRSIGSTAAEPIDLTQD